jgi:chromosome segregation ATPase
VVDVVPDAIVWGFTGGPRAVPGTYRATLNVGDWSESRSFRILQDPRIQTSQADLEEALDLMLQMRSSLDETYDGIRRVRDLRSQVRDLVRRMSEAGLDVSELDQAADPLASKLTAIEEDLMQPKNEADQDVENFPTKLDNQLAYVYWLVDQADARPTEGQRSRYQDLKRDLAAVHARLDGVIDADLAAFESLAREKGATPVLLPKPD